MRSKSHQEKLTFKKKIIYSIVTVLLSLMLMFILGEILIRIVNPQVIQYPRTNYSANYGLMWPANATIINKRPGHWKFIYNTNKYSQRGKAFEVSNNYEKPNIIIMGDSYSFGQGVNDGEEYASILGNKLSEYNVINIGGSGWGFTQELRRYYEFGQLYQPEIIILQFDISDPADNFNYKIIEIENNRFIFNNDFHFASSFKKYLSNSIIQKSCLYNFFRVYIRRTYFSNDLDLSLDNNGSKDTISQEEQYYIDLLENFCVDVESEGIKLIMISVNNQLEEFPYIKKAVNNLEKLKLLNYQEVNDWFEISDEFTSPEGHLWGKKAHKIIGIELSNIIKKY